MKKTGMSFPGTRSDPGSSGNCREIVTNYIPIAFLGVELDRKTSNISNGIGAASASLDGGESHKDGGLARGVGQDWSIGYVLGAFKELEAAMSSRASSMDNSLGDTLMVEAVDLGSQRGVRQLTLEDPTRSRAIWSSRYWDPTLCFSGSTFLSQWSRSLTLMP
jgi:hypothetical protein